ncbi:hypothetical protein HMPREF0682_1080 [Propionibacterium acidifaciens F0233]|uniref:Uncharacterized protein n=1 Tax=Propionibacterium acidifaciens F0233 TaxID=553198 RepID=U2SA83_9ACTN|nr:hypothetical protein HMPREF0682_1080 [Propionibacterium acidifaciens F0233]
MRRIPSSSCGAPRVGEGAAITARPVPAGDAEGHGTFDLHLGRL